MQLQAMSVSDLRAVAGRPWSLGAADAIWIGKSIWGGGALRCAVEHGLVATRLNVDTANCCEKADLVECVSRAISSQACCC